MNSRLLIIFLYVLAPSLSAPAQAQTENDHTHDHPVEAQTEEAGHDHDHDGHDEFIITLSPDAVSLAGIETETATRGTIATVVELPGEVGFDENKLAHIAPRFPGIAQKANYSIGEYAEAGSVMAIVESNESMNPFQISAPISGWVIDKHITPGEFVSGENSIFVLADLTTVWINLAVYPKDIDRVKEGQTVHLKAIGSSLTTDGTIDYIAPLVDLRTRSATARITLPNRENRWRPGTFVQGTIVTPGERETLIVNKAAVQYLDEETVVFVADQPNTFRPVDVTTGDSDTEYIQILDGLTENTRYVSAGAFELKAKIVTSNLDPHAGHGH
jgi:cobalt-zinc-cadmium efflux system membrane fusion protein